MARPFLIAGFAVLAGCYEPSYRDCVTTCGDSGLCPDGLTCTAGFCRVGGATASCEPDANMDACPPVPMGAMCASASPATPAGPRCFVVCSPGTTSVIAQAFSVGMWHVANPSDQVQHDEARAVIGGQTVWIGLTQPAGQATPMDGWVWTPSATYAFTGWSATPAQPDDGDATENDLENCAALTSTGWVDEPCTTPHPFLIEHL